LQDQLGLSETGVTWAYDIPNGTATKRLTLDARFMIEEVKPSKRDQLQAWLEAGAATLQLAPNIGRALQGAVFEIRQGYKSKDSKRQNADLLNATNAYAQGYLPVLFLLSNQINEDIARRYQQGRWLILRGTLEGNNLQSSYRWFQEIIGYDLAAFFQTHQNVLQLEMQAVLSALLGTQA